MKKPTQNKVSATNTYTNTLSVMVSVKNRNIGTALASTAITKLKNRGSKKLLCVFTNTTSSNAALITNESR
ncbi:MAG: GNAT family N-acetyltransferase [Paludibacter sp.]|nr:GNAT family N-acetyltransferase [Paludibacter sp.]